jgi:hypothetical protein
MLSQALEIRGPRAFVSSGISMRNTCFWRNLARRFGVLRADFPRDCAMLFTAGL